MENSKKRQLAILGSTGSIGTQTLQVVEEHPECFEVYALTAGSRVDDLIAQARKFMPEAVVIADETKYPKLKEALSDLPIKTYGGYEAICQIVESTPIDVVVTAMVGFSGLRPTINAIKAGKAIALANKETMVVAGELINALANEYKTPILPVDSEHSAIFQSLKSGKSSEIKRLILTASGGPFFGKTKEELKRVTLSDTLAHPTWKMGKKITVDSATLMNKGFEVIEAAHLFGVSPDKIRVTVHRESILHSAVEYIDNSIIGELSVPDMRMCVQYAVDYPDRCESASEQLDLFKIGKLTFFEPDNEAFPFLSLAKEAITLGGAMPAVMNAADEIAVGEFLSGSISFTEIFDVVTGVFEQMRDARERVELEAIIAADREARARAAQMILSRK